MRLAPLVHIGAAILSVTLLASCGGTGSAAGSVNNIPVVTSTSSTASTTTTTLAGSVPPTLTLSLANASGVNTNTLTLSSPLTVKAKLLDAKGRVIPNSIVTFSSDAALSVLSPPSGNTATNASGIASIVLSPKDLQTAQTQAGTAGTLTASATVGTDTVTATVVYQLGPSPTSAGPATLTLRMLNPVGTTSNSVTPSSPLTILAIVHDGTGLAVPNTIVTFATGGTLTLLSPSSGTTLTDAGGIAVIKMSPKDLQTAQTQAGTADTITAVATVGGVTVSNTATFQLGAAAVTLSLAEPVGGSINLNAYGTTPIKVDVLTDGNPYTGEPVTLNFSSGCATSGRALLPATATSVNGRAQLVYSDKGCGGLDTVTISLAGAQSITADINVAAPVGASIGFVSGTPSDQAIVIQGSGGVGRSETATLTFRALDTFGNPLPNQLINFTVNPSSLVNLQTASATTDSNGLAVAVVNSGTTATTFRVIATFAANPAISTVSGVVTVTTGVPVQASVSLSPTTHNIEGWAFDNVTDTVTILLADAFGNPVADGTPVVFSTDSGAIGSSSNGGCVTANGGCSVSFRSQNPRYGVGNGAGKRAGLATVTASSTTALVTLSGQLGIFLSGSKASKVYLPAGVVPILPTPATNLLPTATCGTYFLTLELNDDNFNPLPSGTAVAVVNASTDLTAGTILPATVPDIFPHDASGNGTLVVASMAARQGSVHTIPMTPAAPTAIGPGEAGCFVGGPGTATGTFDVTVQTPLGGIVSYSFKLTYPTQ